MGDIIDSDYLYQVFDKRRIANLLNDGSGASAATLDAIITAAEGEIKNRLSSQYTVAEMAADLSIKYSTAIFVMFRVELRKSDVSKGIARAYADADRLITQLNSGDSKLSAVEELLPRITQTNAENVFEESGMFEGYPRVEE